MSVRTAVKDGESFGGDTAIKARQKDAETESGRNEGREKVRGQGGEEEG